MHSTSYLGVASIKFHSVNLNDGMSNTLVSILGMSQSSTTRNSLIDSDYCYILAQYSLFRRDISLGKGNTKGFLYIGAFYTSQSGYILLFPSLLQFIST